MTQIELDAMQTVVHTLPRIANALENFKPSILNVTQDKIDKTKQVLIDNGIEADEADTVLQAIGYTLLGIELQPGL